MFYFQNEVENLDIPEVGKITLITLSKLIAAITDKRYSREKKIKKILKSRCKSFTRRMTKTILARKKIIITEKHNFMQPSSLGKNRTLCRVSGMENILNRRVRNREFKIKKIPP